ncbi:MAG: MopE-related protein [Agriterribacter sp.]
MRYIIFTILLFVQLSLFAQSTGDYRSKQSGNWNDATTWQRHNGTAFVDAAAPPDAASGTITIRNGHTIAVNNELNGGQIIIAAGGVLNWANGHLNASLTNNGTINLNGIGVSIGIGNGNQPTINNNGTFNWNDGDIAFYGIIFNNNSGATIFANGNNSMYYQTGVNNIFNNAGIFTKQNGSGTTHFTNLPWTNSGTINGIGTIAANPVFTNTGTIEPGTSPGILQFESSAFVGIQPLSPTSTLQIEIKDGSGPGTGFDQFTINNNLMLAGTLRVLELSETVPNGSYEIIKVLSGTISGNFSTLDLPLGYTVTVNQSNVILNYDDDLDDDGVKNKIDCAPTDPNKWRSAELYIDKDGDGYDNGKATVCYGKDIPSGYIQTSKGSDCNDNDSNINPATVWYKDADGDGYSDGTTKTQCDQPAGYKSAAQLTAVTGDCNDNDATKWRSAGLYMDNDGDGYDGGKQTICYGQNIPAGYMQTTKGSDCNDNDANINPATIWYKDGDNDGYSDGTTKTQCDQPAGYKLKAQLTATSGDCKDDNAAVHPGAPEICGNGIDEDCDGKDGVCAPTDSDGDGVPDNTDCAPNDKTKWQSATLYIDADNDDYDNGKTTICYGAKIPLGYKTTTLGTDCNDNNATVHPGAPEICGNGIDEDCDGKDGVCAPTDTDGDGVPDADDCSTSDPTTWRLVTLYSDFDHDGSFAEYGTEMCIGADIPSGYSEYPGTDCDDSDSKVWFKVTVAVDNDGDGATVGEPFEICFGTEMPFGYAYPSAEKDCNDSNPDIHPGATEICDGIDNNCDGQVDEGLLFWIYPDNDGDGYGIDEGKIYSCNVPYGYADHGGDCKDDDNAIYPGAEEICGDGIDNDCDGQIDEGCSGTGDYYSKPSGDLHNLSTWGINPDGSGTQPTDFGEGKIFNLANRSGNYTMTGNWTITGTLANPSGSQLKINGYTLSLTALTGAGTLSGSTTSNLIITGEGGSNFGTVNFTSNEGILKSLTLNRSGLFEVSNIVTLGTDLSIYDVLTINGSMLNTSDKLTLKSTATGTARFAQLIGGIYGNVTVERYIPARRAWRLMNAPVGGTQTINQAWQEGVTTASANPNPAPGYGTYITAGTVANGFDQNILGQSTSSLKSFTSAGALQAVSSTHTAKVANTPYMLFVRGDRSLTIKDNTVPATSTTLRATGPLLTGDQVIPVAASGFTAVANPFASPINFGSIDRLNVTNSFYVWDPKMGGANGVGAYVNISYNGTGYDITPASVSPESQYIQSGQAFLVQSTGVAGGLMIRESDKSGGSTDNVFREVSGISDQQSAISSGLVFAPARNAIGLRVNLQIANGSQRGVLDEVFASYSTSFSDEIDDMDALKAENMMENLAIIRKGQALMVDRRNLIQSADTLRLNLTNTSVSTYMFEFSPIELSGAESVTLVDNYLKTNTNISLTETSQVFFQVSSDSKSAAADRFSVIIVNKKGLPGLNRNIDPTVIVYPNPATGNNINLKFDNIKGGAYTIELVNNAGQVVYRRLIQLAAGSSTRRVDISNNITSGIYQVRITGRDMRKVVKVLKR